MKVAFQDIQLPAQSQNSPTKLVVWSFSAQSTVPPLRFSLLHIMKVDEIPGKRQKPKFMMFGSKEEQSGGIVDWALTSEPWIIINDYDAP